MRRLTRATVLAAAVTAGLSTAAAAAPDRRPAILDLVINQARGDEAIVYVEAGDLLVATDDLRERGIAVSGGRTVRIKGREFVSIASLGFAHAIDEEAMTARITVPADRLPETSIDLGRRRPAGVEYRRDTSLFLNYGVNAIDESVSGFGEAGLRIGGALAYSAVSFPASATPVRGPSNLTWDDRDDLRRLVAGDRLVSNGALGGTAFIGGVHLLRSFELDPYVVTAPGIDLEGEVLAPSTAEIYVNGVLVRRQQLPPGRFSLDNLPASVGAGNTRVVIRDPLGRQQVLGSNYYLPGGLLAAGLSDYHLTLGARRDNVGTESFDYGDPVLSGRYRRGLGRRITAGAHAEVTPGRGAAGASVSAGVPIGQLELGIAGSADADQLAAAASLAWAYVGRRLSASGSARLIGARFATIDVPAEADRAVFDGRLHVAVPLGRRVTAGAQLSASRFRDAGWRDRASAVTSLQLAGGTTLSLTAGRTGAADAPASFDLFATLTASFGQRTRGSLSHQQTDARSSSQIDLQRSVPAEGGLGYRASARDGQRDSAVASLEARTSFGRYRAGYQLLETEGHSELSAAGGLVFIGGGAFATQPIERSFALVRAPGAGGARAMLENRVYGRTNGRGDLLITGLTPYYGNRVSINAGDVPADRSFARTAALVAPPYRGGAIVELPARRMRLIRGQLAIARGDARIIPRYGELRLEVDGRPLASPVGGAGEFELDGVPAGAHVAVIEWQGGRCRFRLEIPDADGPITDVGATTCRQRIARADR